MLEKYKIAYEGGQGEIVEKKSRFIATIRPVKTEEEALSFIAEMKKKYWDASTTVPLTLSESETRSSAAATTGSRDRPPAAPCWTCF